MKSVELGDNRVKAFSTSPNNSGFRIVLTWLDHLISARFMKMLTINCPCSSYWWFCLKFSMSRFYVAIFPKNLFHSLPFSLSLPQSNNNYFLFCSRHNLFVISFWLGKMSAHTLCLYCFKFIDTFVYRLQPYRLYIQTYRYAYMMVKTVWNFRETVSGSMYIFSNVIFTGIYLLRLCCFWCSVSACYACICVYSYIYLVAMAMANLT